MGNNSKNITKRLVIKSRTENLSSLRDFISDNANNAGLSTDDIDDIILAVDEACTNIIKHAYKSVPDGEIQSGTPSIPHKQWLRVHRVLPMLPDLKKKIDRLEKRIIALENEDREDSGS